ncbi:MAG: threonine synthase [Negativicutes bacterium]
MKYVSTRNHEDKLTAAEVIIKGIAPDGGLYVPEITPQFDLTMMGILPSCTFQERVAVIIEQFLPEFSEKEIDKAVAAAYNQKNFSVKEIAPVVLLEDGTAVLELWHGPTAAFKDMALQLLPQLLKLSMKKTKDKSKIAILTATSGDTGKAALEGFKDVPGTKIIVFYPFDGVSAVQKQQMVTTEGKNTYVIGCSGNFDDAQTGVKNIFADKELAQELLAKNIKLSSANSINWGRLLPQIAYYFSAYAEMQNHKQIGLSEKLNFVVPSGNFGNILAGYYAKAMGLPINKLICASNSNNVLAEFFTTGKYNRKRNFMKTVSPSMDIIVSSNLERLLYLVSNGDSERVSSWMNQLATNGEYCIDSKTAADIKEVFWADWINEEDTLRTINKVYFERGYLLDPHTAVAWRSLERYRKQTGDVTPSVIVSTASPFKFSAAVLGAIGGMDVLHDKDEFQMLDILAKGTGWPIPQPLQGLDKRPVLHGSYCAREEMKEIVNAILLD